MRIYLQAYACIWFQYHYQMPDAMGEMILSKLRLTHWGRVTHICVIKLTIIGSDNGLSPGRRQAIIWTNAGILLIRTLGTNFSEIPCEIHTFSFSKMHLKMPSATWRLFGLGLNDLRYYWYWCEFHNSISRVIAVLAIRLIMTSIQCLWCYCHLQRNMQPHPAQIIRLTFASISIIG